MNYFYSAQGTMKTEKVTISNKTNIIECLTQPISTSNHQLVMSDLNIGSNKIFNDTINVINNSTISFNVTSNIPNNLNLFFQYSIDQQINPNIVFTVNKSSSNLPIINTFTSQSYTINYNNPDNLLGPVTNSFYLIPNDTITISCTNPSSTPFKFTYNLIFTIIDNCSNCNYNNISAIKPDMTQSNLRLNNQIPDSHDSWRQSSNQKNHNLTNQIPNSQDSWRLSSNQDNHNLTNQIPDLSFFWNSLYNQNKS